MQPLSDSARHVLRAALLASGLTYILGAPFAIQVAGAPLGPFLRSWRMYKKTGWDLCEVRFHEHRPGGRVLAVDRYEVLGVDPATAHDVRLLKGPAGVRAMGERLCERLPGADLRVRSRCATADGWVERFNGEEELCARR